jgi:8-oxo-dGTP pyrophosphatase MutT (NUDIX family)
MIKKSEEIIQQAGAIAFKPAGRRPLVLLVRSKKRPAHWIFPKGHIEKGECREITAMRELAEEAGVMGYPVRRSGTSRFLWNDKRYCVVYYLTQFVARIGKGEKGRTPRWCTIQEARALLTIADHRRLLEKMIPYILSP